jgi:DNA repair protein SbcD/Mre11
MIHKFAHITDCHLGAWRNPKLKEINLKAFEKAISICIEVKVDFIAITGDFFDVNVPELDYVKDAVEIMREAKSKGIEIYMIYGSHDFTASTVSVVDILHSAGLFIKPVEFEQTEERIRLKFIQDQNTSFKITGLSGRKSGLDSEYYNLLDMDALESEEGIKIFLFHAPISELTPTDLAFGKSIPLSMLPKGFKYYGGGHLHKRIEYKHETGMIIYPGPLFGSTFTDLEDTAQGEKRGFYIISLESENKPLKADFVEVKMVDIILKVITSNQNTPHEIEGEIASAVECMNGNLTNKIVLIRVKGILSSGKRSDINFSKFEEYLLEKGVLVTFINRNNLVSVQTTQLSVSPGKSKEQIEMTILKEMIASFKVDPSITNDKVKDFVKSKFVSNLGERTVSELLAALKIEKIENETTSDFETRILNTVKEILGFSDL